MRFDDFDVDEFDEGDIAVEQSEQPVPAGGEVMRVGPMWRANHAVPPERLQYAAGRPPAARCPDCAGESVSPNRKRESYWAASSSECPTCDGVGYLGIDGAAATVCLRGSIGKNVMMRARYRQGLPIFDAADA